MEFPSLTTILLFALAFNSFYLIKLFTDWVRETVKIGKNIEAMKNMFGESEHCLINCINQNRQGIVDETQECFQQIKIELLVLQADILKKNPKSKQNHKAPSNRTPRTEEQKALASKQRKEWWDKKRQEKQVNPVSPDDFTFKLPPQEVQNV